MKKITSFIYLVMGVVLGYILISTRFPGIRSQPAQAATILQPSTESNTVCNSNRSVQVTGSAMINVIPDRVMIQLGVQSNGSTPEMVQAANVAAIQSVMKSLQAQGIEAKDITTDYYVVEPVYDNYDSLYIKGYRINNMVAITLRDVQQTSVVIADALEAGSNQVVDVEFYTSDLRKYRDQARDLAMKAAQEKAQALASAAGAQAGCVLTITENSWSFYNGWWYGRSQSLWTQNTVQNAAPSNSAGSTAGDEPISLGQISVKAEVNVAFSLK